MSDRKLGRSTKTIVAYFALAFCAAGCPSTAPAPNEGKTTRSPDAPVAKAGEQVPSGKALKRDVGPREIIWPASTRPMSIPASREGAKGRFKPSAEGGSPESIRSPWGNYVQSDSLVEMLREKGELPTPPNPPGWEDYRDRPVESIVREGRVQFPVVHRLYRAGVLSREPSRRELLVRQITEEIESRKGAVAARINGLIGLIHVGYDEEAMAQIQQQKSARWFASSWDANFYAGTLFFRHGKYAEAVRYLEAAHRIQPEQWSRLWLQIAKDATGASPTPPLFQFGTHMGPGANLQEVSSWPFVNRAEEWGMIRWQLAGALALEDYNNDTWVDFVGTGVHASPNLYWNRPDEGFVFEEVPAFAETGNVPPGCISADFDNDGFSDLFMTRAAWFGNGPNRLFKNLAGKGFEDRSIGSGAELLEQNSCGATTLDFNKDGLVDLAVTGTGGGTLRLLANRGDFQFEDVTEQMGVLLTDTVAVSVSAGDLNGDGWPDLFVNTRTSPQGQKQDRGNGPNQLYLHDGKGAYTECAAERGVAEGTTLGFGSWFFDADNDGDLDILASNFTDEEYTRVLKGFEEKEPWDGYYIGTALYVNDGEARFQNRGEEAGFVPASVMGAQLIDYNLDGWMDVVLGPGSHPLRNMQPLLVYRNNGDLTFTNVAPTNAAELFGKIHGIATADVDHDGDPDLVVNNGGVLLSDRWKDLFLENRTEGASWVHLRLIGSESNRSGVGARVTVKSGEKTWTQERVAGQGFASTNGPYLIFGLGNAERVDGIHILWPSGREQWVPTIAVNQALEVREGSSELRRHY